MIRKDSLTAAMLAGKPLPLTVIDIHGHVGIYSVFHIPRPDAAGMVEVMDRTGVAAVGISAHFAWHADARYGNDYVAKAIEDFPNRFLGYAVANPHYPKDSLAELERCFDTLGFRMIKIHPGVHCYPLNGKGYEGVYRFAEERKAPILTHTWDGDLNCKPDIAAEAAEKHPSVNFIWGHGGAPSFDRALEWATKLPNVYVDLACSRVFLGQLEHFLELAPVEKVLFASDVPFISLPQQLARVAFSDVSEEDKRKVLHDNAAGIIREAGIDLQKLEKAWQRG